MPRSYAHASLLRPSSLVVRLEGIVLWSRRDPRPAGNGSRPGQVLHAACDGEQTAVAMQIWDVEAGHELALAAWNGNGVVR